MKKVAAERGQNLFLGWVPSGFSWNFTSFGHMIWLVVRSHDLARSQVVMSLLTKSTLFYRDPFLHKHGEEVGGFSVDLNSSQGAAGEAIFCGGFLAEIQSLKLCAKRIHPACPFDIKFSLCFFLIQYPTGIIDVLWISSCHFLIPISAPRADSDNDPSANLAGNVLPRHAVATEAGEFKKAPLGSWRKVLPGLFLRCFRHLRLYSLGWNALGIQYYVTTTMFQIEPPGQFFLNDTGPLKYK